MNKRGPNDIWENLYELPLFETEKMLDVGNLIAQENFVNAFGTNISVKSITGPVKHILSHQKLYATFIEIEKYSEDYTLKNDWMYVKMEDLESLAQPKLIFHFFKNFFKLSN